MKPISAAFKWQEFTYSWLFELHANSKTEGSWRLAKISEGPPNSHRSCRRKYNIDEIDDLIQAFKYFMEHVEGEQYNWANENKYTNIRVFIDTREAKLNPILPEPTQLPTYMKKGQLRWFLNASCLPKEKYQFDNADELLNDANIIIRELFAQHKAIEIQVNVIHSFAPNRKVCTENIWAKAALHVDLTETEAKMLQRQMERVNNEA